VGTSEYHRAAHEIAHGRHLAESNPILQWGWSTPAGLLRAERRAGLIINGARLNRGTSVLEIGCGTGMFTELFAATGARIVAVDISPELLDIARKRCLPAERVTFLEKNFKDCSEYGPFDAVIGSSILHHLDTSTAFPLIFELLKPGGLIGFAEPNMLNPQVFLERKFRRFFPYVSPDETAFFRSAMTRELFRSGFVDVSVRPFDWLHPAVPKSLISTVKRIEKILEKIWPIREFAGSLIIRAMKPRENTTEE